MFVEVDYPIDDLPCVVTDDALLESTKVMQHLVQTASCHPFNEDIDVPLVLRGAETTDYVWVREATQHHDFFL